MSLSSIAVANFFIRQGLDEGKELSPMKALKLTYIAHGWFLGFTGSPLISDQVEAWPYGPVIPTLYYELRGFKNKRIDSLISLWNGQQGCWEHPIVTDPEFVRFLRSVWTMYGGLTGLQLSAMTHQSDTPWDRVATAAGTKEPRNLPISNEVIREHYVHKINLNKAAAHA